MSELSQQVADLPVQPGVYLMKNAAGKIIYIGKAKQLKKRVSSYFSASVSHPKTQSLVAQIAAIETIITASENEALVLEANLIKQHRPRYNVLMRDDKSYPYLCLSVAHDFPRLDIHRGEKRPGARYFGPYPSVTAVRETLNLIQKLFRIRQCSDVFFSHRSRPCLQYQIQRCTAPCVDYVSREDYQRQIDQVVLFLEGKSDEVVSELQDKMRQASVSQQYERAAHYRDQIGLLREVVRQQHESDDAKEVDVFALARQAGRAAVSVLCIRGGRLLGKKEYFPEVPSMLEDAEVLAQCVPQYYLAEENRPPRLTAVVMATRIADRDWLESALGEVFGRPVAVVLRKKEIYRAWCDTARKNALSACRAQCNVQADYALKIADLKARFGLDMSVERVECFDVSHMQGEATVASCVVFDDNGPVKSAYRRFSIRGVTAGDDYAAMEQALLRHYKKRKKEEGVLPDVLLIDGGIGQLRRAAQVLEELQISAVRLIGVAKGPGRKGGLETLHLWGSDQARQLPPDSLASHFIQQVRDEAHRFAITLHRQQRGKRLTHSRLELIPGVGPRRREALLAHFGGWQQLEKASVTDIAAVTGVGPELAEVVYRFLHDK